MAKWLLLLMLSLSVSSCASGVLNPVGPVGVSERVLLLNALAIMLVIVVPTIFVTLFFTWWFRASNRHAYYRPDWSYSGQLELLVWSIPALVVLFLGGIGWVSSHKLDPARSLSKIHHSLEIQVVSLDWKWLFIYPDQDIASINYLVIPVSTPIHFRLTSATVMNSFFIPKLGSQIYTMAGMVTQLNLQADEPGHYDGFSAQFSGDGFSDMHFTVDAVSRKKFNEWIARTHHGTLVLNAQNYAFLTKTSRAVIPYTYSMIAPCLFNTIVNLQNAYSTLHKDRFICISKNRYRW